MPKRLEITPTVIDKRMKRGSSSSETLTLRNRGGDSAAYALEDETGVVKDISPDNLIIGPGESQSVIVNLDVPSDAKVRDTIQARIVVANPSDAEDGGQVDIRLHVPIPDSWIAFAIIAIVLIIVLIWLAPRALG